MSTRFRSRIKPVAEDDRQMQIEQGREIATAVPGKTRKAVAVLAAALLAAMLALFLSGCSGSSETDFHNADLGNGWEPTDSMELEYAQNFTVDYFEGGYKLFCLSDGSRFLTIPEGAEVPDGLADDIVTLQQPLENIYLCASDSMCLFDALDSVDAVTVLGTKAEDVHVDSFSQALEDGSIVYGGKYNEPDYELILSKGCPLAIESRMITHSPDVKEKLEETGLAVITEQSSGETNPLGRTEWVKFYGALLDKEELAEKAFEEQVELVDKVSSEKETGKTVAFFYINSNGQAVVRKPGDYVTKMIDMAGGEYVFNDLDASETGMSTVKMEMETFYSTAKDADIIIYNSTIAGGVNSIDELVEKNELLAKCKAVQNGDVWCTDQDMYQEMMSTGEIVSEMHEIFTGSDGSGLDYFYKLE
ncbi:MAG: ABC transporter substrate-binding protein [Coriobacteriales bacterium]|jgi:iron complex transport system substrate-binding protein